MLQNLGGFEAAELDFHKALALDPDNGEIYRTYGATHNFSNDDPLITQIESRYKDGELSDVNRMNLGFAISKAMEDCKEYKNAFPEGSHRYAYNLRDLGIYYKLFDNMIDFWRSTLPGYFHEIHYDALITNPKDETRKLLAACDLEWEDNCLNYHQNKRRIDTLSVYQVRQPIYQSSLKAWERYQRRFGGTVHSVRITP